MERVFDDAKAMGEALRERFEAQAKEAIAARGRYVVALTGGSAAGTLYPALVSARVEWTKVHVFFGDERLVPATHADSNLRAASEAWLSKVSGVQVHAVKTELGAEGAAAAMEAELAPLLPLDAVHLGMGPDGHVASLFPGHALLKERAKKVAGLSDSPKPPPARVTLTLPVLAEARELLFLVQGAAKAEVVKAALEDPACPLPAALAHRGARSSVWFLDRAAAASLSPRERVPRSGG